MVQVFACAQKPCEITCTNSSGIATKPSFGLQANRVEFHVLDRILMASGLNLLEGMRTHQSTLFHPKQCSKSLIFILQ